MKIAIAKWLWAITFCLIFIFCYENQYAWYRQSPDIELLRAWLVAVMVGSFILAYWRPAFGLVWGLPVLAFLIPAALLGEVGKLNPILVGSVVVGSVVSGIILRRDLSK